MQGRPITRTHIYTAWGAVRPHVGAFGAATHRRTRARASLCARCAHMLSAARCACDTYMCRVYTCSLLLGPPCLLTALMLLLLMTMMLLDEEGAHDVQ